jgi:propanediol dehydratase small subunit
MKPRHFDPKKDYPIASKREDLVRTPSGKRLDEITLASVMSGELDAQEMRIRPETLEMQAQTAEAIGRPQLAANFRRAAELVRVPDAEILRIYDALRPNRSTKQGLIEIVRELEERHGAPANAAFVREAMEVYEKRDLLKTE